jgi:hypothetical protein
MIWFDHSIWIMLNNLNCLFDFIYPSLAAKYRAFLTWINVANVVVVLAQITFIGYHRLMEIAMVELATNPSDKLLAKYGNALGTCQIKCLFKPTSVSLETVPSPSLAAYSKRQRLNMNSTPIE